METQKKLSIILILYLLSSVVMGQSYQETQSIQVITHKIIIPEDGTLEEALSLSQEWTENVLKKNPNFSKIELLVSDTKKDTVDLMVLYRLNKNITKNTNEINQELIATHWPEEGSFDAFIKKLRKYTNN